jgi:hypothetical protein
MYLVAWFVVGFILVSAAMRVTQRRTKDDASPQQPETPPASEWILALVPPEKSCPPVQAASSAPAGDDALEKDTPDWARVLVVLLLATAAGFLIIFAMASDSASLWEPVVWMRSPFLGTRFQALFWGAACGAVAQVFRTRIVEMSRQAFDAAIGSKEGTAWALQAALGILIIVAAAFVIKPDLLAYVRSLEFGSFKATFAEHANTTRVADLKYKDLLWGFTLGRYENFERDYIGPTSSRAYFGDRFFDNNVSEERKTITTALASYAQPVVESLICLEKNHPIRVAADDPGLIKYGARWVRFLLKVKSDPSSVNFQSVNAFLEEINWLVRDTTTFVQSIVPDCLAHDPISDEVIVADAWAISQGFRSGIEKLKTNNKTSRSFQTLALIEPYLVGAAADLVVVLNGHKEKAEFLMKMLDGFPKSGAMMTPGIVNIFYQTADAQLQSFESWPVDTILTNLDFSAKSLDALISKTAGLIPNEPVPKEPVSKQPAKTQKPVAADPEDFFGIVNRNLMILLSTRLGLFNQRALAGEALAQVSREDWLRTYSRVVANLDARFEAPILAMDNLPPVKINDKSRVRWPSIEIPPEYLVDVDLATAISSILLGQTQGNVSALSCNTALYYLNKANGNAKAFIDKGYHDADRDDFVASSRDAASRVRLRELSLKRILAIISNWAGSACDWKLEID